jgi:hypothetical protein
MLTLHHLLVSQNWLLIADCHCSVHIQVAFDVAIKAEL